MVIRHRSDVDNLSLSSCACAGRGGARLSHNHERQYVYVLQSLSLWSEIAADMFKLWYLSEQDLLSKKNRYRLQDTGQGLNRVQVWSSRQRSACCCSFVCSQGFTDSFAYEEVRALKYPLQHKRSSAAWVVRNI